MSKWQRVDGGLFGWDVARPISEFTDYLEQHRILACVDCDSGEFVTLRFLVDDEERVAISRGADLASGIDLKDLVEDISAAFDVDAIAGVHIAAEDDDLDEIDAQAEETSACDGDDCTCDQGDGVRAVTLLGGGVGEVAAIARRLDEPIVVLPLDGRGAVLTEEGDTLPGHDAVGEPSVQLLSLGGNFGMVFENENTVASVTWGVARTLTPSDLSGDAAEALEELSRDDELVEAVAALGGDAEALAQALNPVAGGPEALVVGLGLPESVWEFLSGARAAHEVDSVVVITPPTRGETLSYLVDDVLPDTPIVERLEEYEREHPVATRAPSASAILIGAALAGFGLSRTKGLTRTALIGVGSVIVANGIAGLSLTELLRSVRSNRPSARW